ncbi:dienelactone hydrolase family protein [Actinoplanes sp. TFC3]|uniref:dienelactone hydrolase family protein n=1 Tax=Actinoplanes sp. TFC3 TaxID=1710355 RepID=UPI00082B5847|nr:dienelactone hydrolase family protein [Actinoplanes sp. TFC3]
MAELLFFHHAQGLTPGLIDFADTLRDAGHTVHTPDLYEGRTFATLDEGLAYASSVGFSALASRGVAVADSLGPDLVYAGYSLGVMPAQQLAQTRPGAAGALFFESCLPPTEFGSAWPATVPVQIHGMENDEIFAGDGDLKAAQDLVAANPSLATLFVYPGNVHLFADSSLPTYDASAAALLTSRVLAFLTS